jgi:hypothetical protein
VAELDAELTYDLLTFEERDALDAEREDLIRAISTGFPARPGTRR